MDDHSVYPVYLMSFFSMVKCLFNEGKLMDDRILYHLKLMVPGNCFWTVIKLDIIIKFHQSHSRKHIINIQIQPFENLKRIHYYTSVLLPFQIDA